MEGCHEPVASGVECVPPTYYLIGEEKIYAIYLCWIEGVEDAVVDVAICALFEQIVKRMNFAV
jgi:hypothetical protein